MTLHPEKHPFCLADPLQVAAVTGLNPAEGVRCRALMVDEMTGTTVVVFQTEGQSVAPLLDRETCMPPPLPETQVAVVA